MARSTAGLLSYPGKLQRVLMNTLLNIKAFLLVAKDGTFSSAARGLGVAPSVVTKRITQLEEQLGAQLFIRSTRGLSLTDVGEHFLPKFQRLVGELDELISGNKEVFGIEGHLRIKAPTTVTSLYLGSIFTDFLGQHPGLTMDVELHDFLVNPMDDGFDLVVAARPSSYASVVDIPLCPYPLVLCCSGAYVRDWGMPQHPSDLVEHRCLTSILLGNNWMFKSQSGSLNIDVHSLMRANDSRVILQALRRGLGLAILPRYLVAPSLRSGDLVEVLVDYPVVEFWLKALVPNIKLNKPAVRELVKFLKDRMQPIPPWEARPVSGADLMTEQGAGT